MAKAKGKTPKPTKKATAKSVSSKNMGFKAGQAPKPSNKNC